MAHKASKGDEERFHNHATSGSIVPTSGSIVPNAGVKHLIDAIGANLYVINHQIDAMPERQYSHSLLM
jgi:hypothetical protein